MTGLTGAKAHLKDHIPKFTQIRTITRQPAISIGVLHYGETVFTHHLGCKSVDGGSVPDNDTLYCIASLTKQLVAASIAALVADGKISWDTRISSIIPDFAVHADPIVATRATVRDILSHRTGLMSLDQMVQGIHNGLTIEKSETMKFVNALPVKKEFRTGWHYNNMLYSVAGLIIETVSGSAWADFMKERLLKPLGMTRTTASRTVHRTDSNIVKPYVVLTSGIAHEVRASNLSDHCINGSAGGVRSTISDLLKWCSAAMKKDVPATISYPIESLKWDDAGGSGSGRTHTVSEEIHEIFKPAVIIDPADTRENSYGFGLVRQSTPAILGMISPNRRFASAPVGLTSPSQRIFSHHGDFSGTTCSLYLLPDTETAVVVLSNAKGISDGTDWIAQDIIQTLFNLKPTVDFVTMAEESAGLYMTWFDRTIKEPWESNREPHTTARPLEDLVGIYGLRGYDHFRLEFEVGSGKPHQLILTDNNRDLQKHHLSHYHYDTWSFVPFDYDEYLRKGYGPFGSYDEFLIRFVASSDDSIVGLVWRLDGVDIQFARLHPRSDSLVV